MEAVLSALSEKVEESTLNKADTKQMRKKLLRKITNEMFYTLLSEKRLELAPGFGSFVVKDIKEKEKKIYNRRTGEMELRHVSGSKIVYKPGEIPKEFL